MSYAVYQAMDVVLGNEHTSVPVALTDLNDDGPLNFQVARLHLSTSNSATPTSLSGEDQDDSSAVNRDTDIPDPFNNGKKLKNKKKKDDEEDKEAITDLLRETIEEEKIWR